jgi:hypothetical protein
MSEGKHQGINLGSWVVRGRKKTVSTPSTQTIDGKELSEKLFPVSVRVSDFIRQYFPKMAVTYQEIDKSKRLVVFFF